MAAIWARSLRAVVFLASVLFFSWSGALVTEANAILKENADACILMHENRFYGRDGWWKGCQADGCCKTSPCSDACKKSYCILKKEWTVNPHKYCDEPVSCKSEWTCRVQPDR
jgi:hypothetical protein